MRAVKAIMSVFPLDTYWVIRYGMALTESDVEGCAGRSSGITRVRRALKEIDRFSFTKCKERICGDCTGEERQYANLLLVKGVVVPEEEKNNGALLRGAEYYRNL